MCVCLLGVSALWSRWAAEIPKTTWPGSSQHSFAATGHDYSGGRDFPNKTLEITRGLCHAWYCQLPLQQALGDTGVDGAMWEPNLVQSLLVVFVRSPGKSSQALSMGNSPSSSFVELKATKMSMLCSLKDWALTGHIGQALPASH